VIVAKRRRSPQEKKRLSLERDRPVASSEYPKAFRKQWPRKKARAERARRSADRQALTVDPAGFVPARRKRVRKWGTATLGEVIADKLERRAKLRAEPRKSAAARERRRRRRGAKSDAR
jgi:hypothetical protein